MIFVANEQIIHMLAFDHLLTIYHFVGNAGIIRVENKTNGLEVCDEFLIE